MPEIVDHKVCVNCNRPVEIHLSREFYNALHSDARKTTLIQDLPGASKVPPELREMYISGICPTCWDKMFEPC